MASDEESIKKVLRESSSVQLKEAELSADGQSLTLGGTALSNVKLTVEFSGKTASYSMAAIYLQIKDPDQGLVGYRKACKQFQVKDPVKALDKPTVVGYFLGSATAGGSTAANDSAAVTDAQKGATAMEIDGDEGDRQKDAAKRKRESSGGSERDRHRKKDKHHHRSSAEKRDRRDRDHHVSSSAKKKKPKVVSHEQLISNLAVVVDKRQTDQGSTGDGGDGTGAETAKGVGDGAARALQKRKKEEVTKALSAEGFDVTPELLEEHSGRTQLILEKEIAVGNSASILRAANPRKNLSRVLQLYNEATAHASSSRSKNDSAKGPRPPPPKTSSSAAAGKKSYLVGKKPVIVVPKGMQAPITLINAHEFLCNGKFVPRDIILKQHGRKRTPPTTFTRTYKTSGGRSGSTGLVEYEIVDNPKRLGSSGKEWERIVAVLVLGQDWQFKDWHERYNTPVDLFNRTFGFFIGLEGDKIPADINGWSVKQSKLNRDKRGLDSVTYASFWNSLDEWMSVNKRELLPQPET